MVERDSSGPTHVRVSRRLVLAAAVGVACSTLIIAAVLVLTQRWSLATPLSTPGATHLTMTTGSLAGRRNEIAQSYLAPAAARYGLEIQIVETVGSEDSLNQVNAGAIDLALSGGGLSAAGRDNVREIMPLYVEPLHLLIRADLAAMGDPTTGLASELRGQTISFDLVGTGTRTLVAPPAGLLGALGLTEGDFTEDPMSLDQLADPALDCAGLPGAIFVLGPLPHPGAANLVTRCNYHLHTLPFADALHLTRNHIYAATIPAGTYRLDPPEPPRQLETIGTQLLLVVNKDQPDEVVEKLISAVLETSFSHLYEPPLTIEQLSIVPEFPQHPGDADYIDSRKPVTFQGLTDGLTTASTIIALVTGAIPITMVTLRVLSQWRQREQVVSVRQLMAEALLIERQARELEHAPGPTADPNQLHQLRNELLRLRSTALHKSSAKQLQEPELLPSFLSYVADVLSLLGRLMHTVQAPPSPQSPTSAP
jgi:TRAP-type uncharacterized transport system substrate-binding protein